MKPPKTQHHESAEAKPSIAAMPPPDPVAALQSQLDEALASAAALEGRLREQEAEKLQLLATLEQLEKNPLVFALASLDAGSELEQAGVDFTALCAEIAKRQQKGSMTLKVVLKPFKGDSFTYALETKVTKPAQEATPGIIYIREDGTLSRNDPRQKHFEFPKTGYPQGEE